MLTNLKVTELKEMAKEAKVKNWWTLKKADLVKELEKINEVVEEEPKKVKEAVAQVKALPKGEDNIITLKELVSEVGVKGTKARRLLRGSTIARPFNRWEWDKDLHEDIIEEVYALLKGEDK